MENETVFSCSRVCLLVCALAHVFPHSYSLRYTFSFECSDCPQTGIPEDTKAWLWRFWAFGGSNTLVPHLFSVYLPLNCSSLYAVPRLTHFNTTHTASSPRDKKRR